MTEVDHGLIPGLRDGIREALRLVEEDPAAAVRWVEQGTVSDPYVAHEIAWRVAMWVRSRGAAADVVGAAERIRDERRRAYDESRRGA